jgi:hypothetical protein
MRVLLLFLLLITSFSLVTVHAQSVAFVVFSAARIQNCPTLVRREAVHAP